MGIGVEFGMIKHMVILSSSYSTGTRIGLHYIGGQEDLMSEDVKKVGTAYPGAPFSTHQLYADSESWDSVVKKDPYFDDVKIIKTADEFTELLRREQHIDGKEVARYILSRQKCTHTRIQKLTYMCYADYLCSTGKRLFEDKIYAFDHGPVVASVYEAFRDSSKAHPGKQIDYDDDTEIFSSELRVQHRSRIMFSEDGVKKMDSIDRTLERYGELKTEELVELTYRPGSPWFMTPKGTYSEIADKSILAGHAVEVPDAY